MTPCFRYQRKTFILSGSFTFQAQHQAGNPVPLIRSLYIEPTVNVLLKHQEKASLWLSSCTHATSPTSLCHRSKLLPDKVLLKEIPIGFVLSTLATVTCLFLTMLYRDGNCFIKGLFPIHKSYQNLTWLPSCTTNRSLSRKSFLTSISPLQNCKSPCLFSTWDKVLFLRYFFLSKFYHRPSSFKSLNNHLLNKHLFCVSKFIISNPPTLFG